MATGRAIFQAHVDGLFPESLPFDLLWTIGSAVGQIQTVSVAATTDVTVPTQQATLILIIPPPTNAAVLRVAGNTGVGANGYIISSSMPTVLSASAGTVLVIHNSDTLQLVTLTVVLI